MEPPPISIRTCAVVAPFFTSTIFSLQAIACTDLHRSLLFCVRRVVAEVCCCNLLAARVALAFLQYVQIHVVAHVTL